MPSHMLKALITTIRATNIAACTAIFVAVGFMDASLPYQAADVKNLVDWMLFRRCDDEIREVAAAIVAHP